MAGDKRLVELVADVLGNPKQVRFETLRSLLEAFGYQCRQPRGGSSHYVFRKAGSMPLSVPKDRPVNRMYVVQVIKLLKLEEWYEKNGR